MNSATNRLEPSQEGVGLLEQELAARKSRLAQAKSDLHHRFQAYAEEQACVAVLEKALAKAHRLT